MKRCERVSKYSDLECGGSMLLERYNSPCKACKDNGATICGNCLVMYEWSCIRCGNVVHLPVKRRKDNVEPIQAASKRR